jgi:two-component system chemotaxis sensor kinase CheA
MDDSLDDLDDLDLFLIETESGLITLKSSLGELKKNISTKENYDLAKRAAHTIKGGARLMGFSKVESYSYRIELTCDQLRSEEIIFTKELIDLLLKMTDALTEYVDYVKVHGNESDHHDLQLNNELDQYLESQTTKTTDVSNIHIENSNENVQENHLSISEVDNKSSVLPEESAKEEENIKSSVKIDINNLEVIMNLVGEIVLCRNQMMILSEKEEDPHLSNAVAAFSSITSELQESVMSTRMLSLETLFSKYNRMVRDLSSRYNKKITLSIKSQDAELDRTILEALNRPLMRILECIVEFSIESPEVRVEQNKESKATISLNSYYENGQIVIEIMDDGAGFDIETVKKNLEEAQIVDSQLLSKMTENEILLSIFHPDYHLNQENRANTGKGELAIIRTEINEIGGQISVQSHARKSTIFKLHIPQTLTVMPGITVVSAGETYVVPQNNLQEIIRIKKEHLNKIEHINGQETYRLRGNLLPILNLNDLVGYQKKLESGCYILVLICGDEKFGLIVEEIFDIEEIVVKPLSKHLEHINLFLGSTLLGNGEVALILDIMGVGARKNIKTTEAKLISELCLNRTKTSNSTLLFSLGCSEVYGIQMSQVRRLEEINISDIELTQNRQVIQYCGGILPLIELDEAMKVNHQTLKGDIQSLVVVSYRGHEVGLKVNKIIDSVEYEGELNTEIITDRCVMGIMMIDHQPTLLIDTFRVFDHIFNYHNNEFDSRSKGRIFYIDDSAFFLNIVSRYLTAEGYECIPELSPVEGYKILCNDHFDALLVDLDMPEIDGFEIIQKCKEHIGLKHLPIIALSSIISSSDRQRAIKLGAEDCLVKLNRQELLNTIEKYIVHEATIV